MFTFIIVSLIFIILVMSFWIYCQVEKGYCLNSRHLVGKVVIVTGGTSGIGFKIALDLAERGARVIIASNERNGETVQNMIVAQSGNDDVHFQYLDLASFESVKEFSQNILISEKRLDVLINNAGAYFQNKKMTEDGLLAGMQVNYFGPFLLTNLLLPLLLATAPSRIINVSSFMHKYGQIDLEDLNMESWKSCFADVFTYCNSKLCVALMTLELDRRLQGKGVTVNFLHPGIAKTNIVVNTDTFLLRTGCKFIKTFIKTKRMAAQTAIYLAVSPDVQNVSGRYFVDCRVSKIFEKAQDKDLANKLWNITEEIVRPFCENK